MRWQTKVLGVLPAGSQGPKVPLALGFEAGRISVLRLVRQLLTRATLLGGDRGVSVGLI